MIGLKRMNPNLKVLVSVTGGPVEDSVFSKMVASAARRQKFIRSAVKFLDAYHFDGIDLDWEFPGSLPKP